MSWVCLKAHAQCPTTIPNLVDYGTGSYAVKKVDGSCLPVTVSVKSTLAGVTNVRTVFDYKGGAIDSKNLKTDTLHTYKIPGQFTIVQFSEKDGRKLIACQTVYVKDTVPPDVKLISCGINTAKILFYPNSPYDSHWIRWGDGAIQELSSFAKSATHTYASDADQKITVWGTYRSGNCQSGETLLDFEPTSIAQKSAISGITMLTTTKADLTIINPLDVELLLMKSQPSGLWEQVGRTGFGEKERLQVGVDSTTPTCFRLEPTDTCYAGYYKSDVFCSAVWNLNALPTATDLSWKTNGLPADAIVSIEKDGKEWFAGSSKDRAGTQDDMELICGLNHCYQLFVTYGTFSFSSLPLCRQTPDSFCGVLSPLFVPDAFSPNDDGINDYFEIKGKVAVNYELTVFSSWGTVVFHSTDVANSWDGKLDNRSLPTGYYAYTIKVDDPKSNTSFNRKGRVLLLK